MARAIPLLALLACLAFADVAGAAERCKVARGSDTISRSSHIWVYRPADGAQRDPNFAEQPTYACNRRTGRRFLLDAPRRETYVEWEGSYGRRSFPPQVAGTHLAYVNSTYDGADDESKTLYVLDLAKATKRRLGSWSLADRYLGVFRLRSNGAVAWSTGTDEGDPLGEVWLWSGGERKLLDSGPALDAMSFAVTRGGDRIYWMNGDQPGSAQFR